MSLLASEQAIYSASVDCVVISCRQELHIHQGNQVPALTF